MGVRRTSIQAYHAVQGSLPRAHRELYSIFYAEGPLTYTMASRRWKRGGTEMAQTNAGARINELVKAELLYPTHYAHCPHTKMEVTWYDVTDKIISKSEWKAIVKKNKKPPRRELERKLAWYEQHSPIHP